MPTDLWEQLAQTPVPPPPKELDQGVRQRINTYLMAGHLADFLFRVLPYGMYHFARGLLGAVMYSLSGRYPLEQKRSEKNSPPDVT